MTEAGGPTTQAGIAYQDSIAALYLGRLCDMQARSLHESIVEVRVEAPAHVDDIVVTYSDRHKEFFQVKENVNKQDDAWKKMWSDLFLQRNQESFHESDKLVLIFGSYKPDYTNLQEIVLRANGSQSATEWIGRLNSVNTKLLENIKTMHPSLVENSDLLFHLFQCLRVEIIPYNNIERDFVPYWIPSSNQPKVSLFKILCNLAGHHARNRRSFTTLELLSELEERYNFLIEEPQMYGTKLYTDTVRNNYGHIGIPCTPFHGPIEQLFVWPKLQQFDPKYSNPLGNIEDPHHFSANPTESIVINEFPNFHLHRVIIIASAGFGKTTLLHAIIHKLADTNRIPVFIGLLDFASSKQSVAEYLSSTVNRQYCVQIPWEDYCDKGRVVLFFDGLDELAPGEAKSVLSSISIFSNRFPNVSWMLTVRDIGAVTSPLPADTLSLKTLDKEDMHQFCEAYGNLHGDIDKSDFLTRISNQNDLKSLASIPLFLSLLICTYIHHRELPRTRAELLDQYTSIIFHPEEYKDSIQLAHDAVTIQRMAELLSYNALERGKIGFTEREIDNILRLVPTVRPSQIVQDLRLCGILQKNAFTLRFFFPVVQEYLASCYVLDNLSVQEIVEKFKYLSKRPWAQALQFALEKHPDSQTIISVLLETPDDAFDSLKILLGRCIANGSHVSTDLRQKVGESLTTIWLTHSIEHARNIGLILRDGFTAPLPPLLRSLLEHGKGIYVGGKEILEASQDDSIVLKAVNAILDSPSDNWHKINSISSANRAVANQILEMYVEYCEKGPCSAYPMFGLDRNYLQPEKYKLITENPNIPPHIRLAAYYRIGPLPVPQEVHQIIKMILHPNMKEEYFDNEFSVATAISVLLNTADWQQTWLHYFNIVPDNIKQFMITAIRDRDSLTTEQRLIMLRAMEDNCHNMDLTNASKLCQAYLSLPDDTILKEIPLVTLSNKLLIEWLLIASRIKSSEPLATGIRYLYAQDLSSRTKMVLSRELSSVMRFDIFFEGDSYRYEPNVTHPTEMEFRTLLKHWETETAGTDDEVSVYMTTQLHNLGDLEARDRLVKYLNIHLLDMVDSVNENINYNIAVSNYLSSLEKNYVLLDLDLLEEFTSKTTGNAARVALIMLLKHSNKDALIRALRLLNQCGDDEQGYLNNKVRILASKLGVSIIKQDECYVAVN